MAVYNALTLVAAAVVALLAAVAGADQTFSWGGSEIVAVVEKCEQVTITSSGSHNIYQLNNSVDYLTCTFGSSDVQLAATGFTSYVFPRSSFNTTAAEVYIVCEIAEHCASLDFKGVFTVSSTVYTGYQIVNNECVATTGTSAASGHGAGSITTAVGILSGIAAVVLATLF